MNGRVCDLAARGVRVFALCQQCGAVRDVDLSGLAGDLDLTDRHPPCRAAGCAYWVGFYAQQGQRTVRLSTPAGDDAESERRTAWLLRRPGP